MPVLIDHSPVTITDSAPPAGGLVPEGVPPPPQPAPVPVNPTLEIVASSPVNGLAASYAYWASTLPHPTSILQRDFGLDIYETMSRDPQIRAALRVLVNGALNQPLALTVPFKEDDRRYSKAQQIRDFCQVNLDRLPRGIIAILGEMMMAALINGHKVAELLAEQVTLDGRAGPQLLLRDIKTKPLTATAFVQDAYGNTLGLLAQRPGRPLIALPIIFTSDSLSQPILPLSKFAVLTLDQRDNDPRGNCILLACYGPWWEKQQLLPLLLAYATRFGQPSVAIVLPPNAGDVPQTNADGSPAPAISLSQAMLNAGKQWQGGGVIVVPNGTDPRLIEVNGSGYQMLTDAITLCDTQIVKALLGATLATNEGTHRSGVDATIHQDVLNLSFRVLKTWGANFTKWQLLARVVEWNYGKDALALLPNCELGQTDPEDFSQITNAIAQLENAGHYNPAVVPTAQRELLDARTGLPFVPGLSAVPQPTPTATDMPQAA